ncbi:MAG TPA: hypothetical protein IGP91_08190 [Thermosynechococcus sp. M46_R2017_013]|nr:hypothetical protein [Thermosynechococcus sp. M46_R2017_013]
MRPPVFDRILPAFFYERIATVLLAEASHRGATVLTREELIASADAPFLVVVAETFALLLQAEPVPQTSAYRVQILTDPAAIARFLRKIRSQVPVKHRPLIRTVLQQLTALNGQAQMLPTDLAIALWLFSVKKQQLSVKAVNLWSQQPSMSVKPKNDCYTK